MTRERQVRFYRPTRAGRGISILGSRYKALMVTADLCLQERKKLSKKENDFKGIPNYRIITRVGRKCYIVWHGDTLEHVVECEWKYIVEDIPKIMPKDCPTGTKKARDWLLVHFSHLTDGDGLNGVAWSDAEGSEDDDYDSDEYQNEVGKGLKPVASSELISTSSSPSLVNMISPNKLKRKTSSEKKPESRVSRRRELETSASPGNTPPMSPKYIPPPNYYKDILPARLVKCIGALLATNASFKLVTESNPDHQAILQMILNLFVMYVILVHESNPQVSGGLHTGASKFKPTTSQTSGNHGTTVKKQVLFDTDDRTDDGSVSVELNGNEIDRMILKFPKAGSTLKQVDMEVAEKNSWAKIDASLFNLRCGPDYAKNKKKEPSGVALTDLLSCDLFETNAPIFTIQSSVQIPEISNKGTTAGVPHMIIFNSICPLWVPSMWGGERPENDLPGFQLVMYGVLSENTLKQLRGELPISNAVKLLQDYCNNIDDVEMTNRTKVVPHIVNPEEALVKCGSLSRSVVKSYNGTPVLTRPEHRISISNDILQIDFNGHEFAYLTRKSIYSTLDVVPEFRIDMCLVIQGVGDEELPEVALLCARFNHLNNSPNRLVQS